MVKEADADERTGEVQEGEHGRRLAIETDQQTAIGKQPDVRSTIHRTRPSGSLDSMPRLAIRGVMPRRSRA
jgi:hypothetical protein